MVAIDGRLFVSWGDRTWSIGWSAFPYGLDGVRRRMLRGGMGVL